MNIKELAEKYNLRIKREWPSLTADFICPGRGKKFEKCHIYDGFNEGFGVHIEQSGAKAFKNLISKIQDNGVDLGLMIQHETSLHNSIIGANFKVFEKNIAQVASVLKIAKLPPRGITKRKV